LQKFHEISSYSMMWTASYLSHLLPWLQPQQILLTVQ
jgi:hypothetical protein